MNPIVSLTIASVCLIVATTITNAYPQEPLPDSVGSQTGEGVGEPFQPDQATGNDDDSGDEECKSKKLSDNDPTFNCPSVGLHSDPASCKNFYQCDNANKAVKWECCGDLVFDPVFHFCNWKANVDCEAK